MPFKNPPDTLRLPDDESSLSYILLDGTTGEITLVSANGAKIVLSPNEAYPILKFFSTIGNTGSIKLSDFLGVGNLEIQLPGGFITLTSDFIQVNAQIKFATEANLYVGPNAREIRSDGRINQRPLQAIYSLNAATAIASGGAGAIGQYDTVIANFNGDIGQVGGQFTIPAGWGGSWRVTSSVEFSLIAAPAGIRLIQIRRNGTTIAESRVGANPVANQPTALCVSVDDVFVAGDIVDIFLLHTQGVGLTYGGAGQARFTTSLTFAGRVV